MLHENEPDMDTVRRTEVRDDEASGRRATVDDLLDELTAWSPRDRAGTFRKWHHGALSLIQLNVVSVLEADGPLPMSRLADLLGDPEGAAGEVRRLGRADEALYRAKRAGRDRVACAAAGRKGRKPTA